MHVRLDWFRWKYAHESLAIEYIGFINVQAVIHNTQSKTQSGVEWQEGNPGKAHTQVIQTAQLQRNTANYIHAS